MGNAERHLFTQFDRAVLAIVGASVTVLSLLLWLYTPDLQVILPVGATHPVNLLLLFYACVLLLMFLGTRGLTLKHIVYPLCLFALLVIAALVAVYLRLRLPNFTLIWDDALMFGRYVYNMRTYGEIAWNIDAGATYGSTELLHLLIVWAFSWFVGADAPHAALHLASVSMGVVFLLLLAWMVWCVVETRILGKVLALSFIFGALALQFERLLPHFYSGMGTTGVLAYVTAYLLVMRHYTRHPSRRNWLIAVMMGGVALAVRPDLGLFAVCIPLGVLITADNRRHALGLMVGIAAVMGIFLLLAWVYFGSPVPLSFYAKSLDTLYGDASIYTLRETLATEQSTLYLRSNVPLFFICALGLLRLCRFVTLLGGVGFGAIVAAVLYVAYYTFFVLQIMYFDQRFYYPTLPVIVYVAACALAAVLPPVMARVDYFRVRINVLSAVVVSVLSLVVALVLPWGAFITEVEQAAQRRGDMFVQPSQPVYTSAATWQWFAIDALSQLPLTVATTEVGLPAVASFEWVIYDLSALNDTQQALNGFDVDLFFDDVQPDVIYMPFIDYTQMHDEISTHPVFLRDYAYYDRTTTGSNLSMALHVNSPHYPQMQAIIDDALRRVSSQNPAP